MRRSASITALALALLAAGCNSGDSAAPPLASTTSDPRAPDEAASAAASADASAAASASADPDGQPEIPQPGTPIVDLGGVTSMPAPIAADRPKLGVIDWVTRVYARASRDSKVRGYLRAGAVVEAVETAASAPTSGCSKGWRAILPAGQVCLDDVTEDMDHPVLLAASHRPDFAYRLPYMYGTVTRGGPVYDRLPTAAHLKQFEPSLKDHLNKWKRDKVSGAAYGLDVWLRYTEGRTVPGALEALEQRVSDDDIPPFLLANKRVPAVSKMVIKAAEDAVKVDQVNRRQGRSFTHSFLYEGRRYNVTPDLVVIPADRFRPIRGSAFAGYRPDLQLKFPFALIRRSGAYKWRWDGKKMVKGEAAEWRSAIELTGKQRFYNKRLHFETSDGFWLSDRKASRVDPAKRWPKWAEEGAKWIDVNITEQVLVAYEGKKMVYATIVSTGEAGLGDPDGTTATKRGIFRIHTKYVSVTMDSDIVGESFELRDVPYVQYFEGGYALHGAYWHDSFGRPKSHGCINLAPEDARRLFFWTDPPVPMGWHGARQALTGTRVFVHP